MQQLLAGAAFLSFLGMFAVIYFRSRSNGATVERSLEIYRINTEELKRLNANLERLSASLEQRGS
jgi:hypothetical protein